MVNELAKTICLDTDGGDDLGLLTLILQNHSCGSDIPAHCRGMFCIVQDPIADQHMLN